jgi:hypothetical protein
MTVTADLAGLDVFLRNTVEHTACKITTRQRFSFRRLPPLNQDVETAAKELNLLDDLRERRRDDRAQPTSHTFWRTAA